MMRKNMQLLAISSLLTINLLSFAEQGSISREQCSQPKLKTEEEKAEDCLDTCDVAIKYRSQEISRQRILCARGRIRGTLVDEKMRDCKEDLKSAGDAWQVCFAWRKNPYQSYEQESECLEAMKKAGLFLIVGLKDKTFSRKYLDQLDQNGDHAASTFLDNELKLIVEQTSDLKSELEQVKDDEQKRQITYNLTHNEILKANIERIQRHEEEILKAHKQKQRDFMELYLINLEK